MTKRASIVRVLYWVVFALLFLCWLGYVRHVKAVQQRTFGRYTEDQVIALATPVIQAILPNRNDLYVTTEHSEVTMANNRIQRLWIVDCLDSHGNHLIHVARDAVSGTICLVGYDWPNNTVLPPPVSLSPQAAANEAQRWMHILGFKEEWHQVGIPVHNTYAPQYPYSIWFITLQRPGWRAHVTISERAGALVFARVVPTR